ncbi:hypothetical protein B0T26DRAFT_644673, partial [Lasiosphaeria miniovina]
GAWVEALPDLISNRTDAALDAAVKAFALSILAGGPTRSVPIPAGLEAYGLALQSLRTALRSSTLRCPEQLAAAIMCLLLAEIFLPTSLDARAAHLQGFGELMRLSGPELYASGVPHKLFVGARPSLVIMGIHSRKASFLAAPEWIHVPFGKTAPSAMQQLMSEGAMIPSIFEIVDKAAGAPGSAIPAAREAIHRFKALLDRLRQWEERFQPITRPPSMSWVKPATGPYDKPWIWFRSITDANALTNLWAFKTICLTNVEMLTTSFPDLVLEDEFSRHGISKTSLMQEAVHLATMICQSVGYLMQGEMKLFGPTSVLFPLRTAHDTFREGGSRTTKELSWFNEILVSIYGRDECIPLFFTSFRNSLRGCETSQG